MPRARRKATSFEKDLIRAMEEAVDIARGKRKAAREYTVTIRDADAHPAPSLTRTQIVRIRESLGVSQAVFAKLLNVSSATARSWEQGVKPPSGPARRLLEIAAAHPDVILGYMHERN